MPDSTLIDILQRSINQEGRGITFIKGSNRQEFLSYGELAHLAKKALCALQSRGIRPGNELMFQVNDNKTFVIAFWACILGGILPIPLAMGLNDDNKLKLFTVWPVLKDPWLVISPDHFKKLEGFAKTHAMGDRFAFMSGRLIHDSDLLSAGSEGELFDAREEDIAFVQFSSGSTGDPKGVVLTHANLLVNMAAIARAAAYTSSDRTFSWMPLSHDMGLIGFHLNPLFSGMDQCLMDTHLFIRRPVLWLEKADEYRATILCSPNFGYRYLINHTGDTGPYQWDLSCIRIIYNGAEPVSAELGRDFLRRFAGYGLKSVCMCPVYGLAEATLAVSVPEMNTGILSLDLERSKLNCGDPIAPCHLPDSSAEIVSLGRVIGDCQVRITDKENRPLADETVGRVWIKGKNVTTGYYNNVSETRTVLSEDGWLDTGDLGFLKEGYLYITGRAKEIFFINGQNYYPHDIERTAEELEGIELNKIAVAGYFDREARKDTVIAFIFHRGDPASFLPVADAVKGHILKKTGLEIDRVIPVKDIPRTTSGKLQRYKLLERFVAGEFRDPLPEHPSPSEVTIGMDGMGAADQGSNDTERKILRIWEEVLNTGGIGPDQDFFSAGGNSLRAAQVAMGLIREFQVELPPETFYEKRTVRELAEEIVVGERSCYTPIPLAPESQSYPVSPAQKRIWHFSRFNPGSVAYNIPFAFRITGGVDSGRLERCIRRLIDRHETLRTSFFINGSGRGVAGQEDVRMRVHAEAAFTLSYTVCPEEELDPLLRRLVQPFDLGEAPLFRIWLIKITDDRSVVFLDFHHIISDGLSVSGFIDELFLLYKGEELPALSIQYKDYCHWQIKKAGTEEWQRQRAYWMERLKGELPVLEMPLDLKRPPIFSPEGGKRRFEIGGNTAARLRQLATDQRCSLHVLLFAIYNVLLTKSTGQGELLIGIPVAGRRHPDLQRMQGMFVNNLVIRCLPDGDGSFAGWLQKAKGLIGEALDNQEYPFDTLLRDLGGKRDVGRNPLFDSMFIYQNMGLPQTHDPALTITPHLFDPGFSKFDLSMEFFDYAGQGVDDAPIPYHIEYASNLFRPGTIGNLSSRFELLMENILRDPGVLLGDLPSVTGDEYEEYITGFNATDSDYPRDETVLHLIEEQVERTPDRIAIIYNEEKISYGQLNDQAALLAAALREKGLVPGGVAAIYLERSPLLIVCILAVWKAGGCYVPVDTGLPVDRIRFLVADSRCGMILSGAGPVISTGSENDCQAEWIDVAELVVGRGDDPGRRSPDALVASCDPSGLAYIIYTSGTTGVPKGVMIGHRSLVNYIWWAAEKYIQGEPAAFPLYTSISFDLTVTSLFAPLITGNWLIIYEETGKELPVERVLMDNRVEIIKLTPSHLRILAENRSFRNVTGSRLKRLIVGGEQLESRLAREVYEMSGGQIEIYNEYGPTEATVGCMIHCYDPEEEWPNVPIGIPAANTRIYILDKYHKPVPDGVSGELYISGDGIARGYINREELTNSKFVPDPFRADKKMYKTGDLARRLPGGVIEFIGRSDQQIKINGYRIEPAEIELQLVKHPDITDALVTIRTGKNNDRYLVAYYKSSLPGGADVAEGICRDWLAGRLPHYMIPVFFIPLEEIPLTHNGKVDQDALPGLSERMGEKVTLLPVTEFEKQLAGAWRETLGVKELSVTDNFFEAGGDSIRAVQMASRLLEQGILLQVKDILIYQTIRQIGLHAIMQTSGNAGYEQGVVSGEKQLSFAEAWFFGNGFANQDYYNQSVLLVLNRRADPALLRESFGRMILRHDGLRMNYDPGKGTLFFNNRHLEEEFALPEYELDPGDAELASLCTKIKSSFTITRSLLIKAAIIREPGGREFLFITAHHLVMDGVSWRILLRDLYTVYDALDKSGFADLSGKTASLIDWEKKRTRLEAAGKTDEVTVAGKTDRRIKLSGGQGPDELIIRPDWITDDWRMENAGKASGHLDKSTTSFLLKKANQAYGTDALVLLYTALALTLKEESGRGSFVIEHESHGRQMENIDVSGTVGWFTVLHPLRLEIGDDPPGDQIKSIKEQVRSATGQGIGKGIPGCAAQQLPRTGAALTEIRFNYLGQFDKELNNDLFSWCDLPTGSDSAPENNMTARLELNSMVIDGGLILDISYNRKAYRDAAVHRLIRRFFRNLERVLDHLRKEENEYFTPSDFEAVQLDQSDLDLLFS